MQKNKTALVTGAAGGIGLACVQELAQHGDHVLMVDRSEDVMKEAELLRDKGFNVDAYIADLSKLDELEEISKKILNSHGGVDVLVNNAGVHPKVNGRVPGFEDISAEDWEFVFRINVTTPFVLSQKFLGYMKENKWGRVINIASRAGRAYSDRAGAHYSASKAAVIGMTRKFAGDYASYGITANCIAPGQIMTPLAKRSAPEVLEAAIRRIPVGRIGTSEEIAAAVAYYRSDIASFITGTVLDVNGGETML